MKLNKFLWSLAAISALCLASCAADKVADEPQTPVSDGNAKYITVSLENVDNGSRSGTFTDPYEDSNPGTEKAVKSVRLYFFNNDGNPVTVGATNYVDIAPTGGDSDNPNVDWAYSAKTVAVNVTSGANLPTKLVAIANATNLPAGSQSLAQLEAIIENYAATADNVKGTFDATTDNNGLTGSGLVMSSSVYAAVGEKKCEVILNNDANQGGNANGIFDTPEAAAAHPTIIHIERVNAKVRMHLSASLIAAPGVKTDDGTTDLTNVYNVKNPNDKANNLTIKVGDDNVEALVQLHGWYVTAEMLKSYLLKHINATWDATTFFGNESGAPVWTDASKFRSFWALNPTGQTLTYTHNFDTNNALGMGTAALPVSCYTQENAADNEDGTKATDGLLNDNRNTKVLVLGTIGYKGAGNKFTPLNYVEWAGNKYIDDANGTALKEAIFTSMKAGGNLNYWTESTEDAATTDGDLKLGYGKYTNGSITKYYRQLAPSDVKVVTASEINPTTGTYTQRTVGTYANEKRYQVYLQLNDEAEDLVWKSLDDPTGANATTLTDPAKTPNAAFVDFGGAANFWKGGMTYYFFDIKHIGYEDNGAGADKWTGKGDYGVVRNHIYDCTVNSVVGLGTPVYDPNQFIVPEKVIEEESYLSMVLKVLSWRVVTNNVNLGE